MKKEIDQLKNEIETAKIIRTAELIQQSLCRKCFDRWLNQLLLFPKNNTEAFHLFQVNCFTICIIHLEAVLTRDFIKDALYNPQEGYNRNKKCGVLEAPIDFGSLWGKWEFNKTIQTVYKVIIY